MNAKALLDDAAAEAVSDLRIDLSAARSRASHRQARIRRRATATMASAVAIAALVALITILLPVGESMLISSPATNPVSAVARVDVAAGTILLPLDRYSLTEDEYGIVLTANDLAMSRCMDAAGDGSFFPFYDRRHVGPDVDWRYGVWVESQVAHYGYQKPPASELGRKIAAAGSIKFPPRVDETYAKCVLSVKKQGLAFVTPPDDNSSASGEEQSDPMDSEPAKKVILAWHQCLGSQGVEPPREGGYLPPGILQAPLKEQIRVGLIDVKCKASVDMIQRLADIDAQSQIPYIRKHETQLLASKQDAEKVLKTARAYLAAHPA